MSQNLRTRNFTSISEVRELHHQVVNSAAYAVSQLRSSTLSPLRLLSELKFSKFGLCPLTKSSLNLIEQINQTFTLLVTLQAVEWLFAEHPNAEGYKVNFGTASGRDIESVRWSLVSAEAFAATHPRSNGKLGKDLKRLSNDPAENRYVFFSSPGFSPGRCESLEKFGVRVFAVDLPYHIEES